MLGKWNFIPFLPGWENDRRDFSSKKCSDGGSDAVYSHGECNFNIHVQTLPVIRQLPDQQAKAYSSRDPCYEFTLNGVSACLTQERSWRISKEDQRKCFRFANMEKWAENVNFFPLFLIHTQLLKYNLPWTITNCKWKRCISSPWTARFSYNTYWR